MAATATAKTTPRDPRNDEKTAEFFSTAADAAADVMNATFAAQRQMLDAMTSMTSWTRGFTPETPSVEAARTQATRFWTGAADIASQSMTEMTGLVNDQFRVANRMTERAFDAFTGPNAARTPAAFLATGQQIATDCVENAASAAEKLVRLGASEAEAMQELFTACCKPAAGKAEGKN